MNSTYLCFAAVVNGPINLHLSAVTMTQQSDQRARDREVGLFGGIIVLELLGLMSGVKGGVGHGTYLTLTASALTEFFFQ